MIGKRKNRAEKLQEIEIHHRKLDQALSLVEYGVKYKTDKKECLFQFTDKIKFRIAVKEQNMFGTCAESKLLTKDSDYTTHENVKAFTKN